MTRFSFPPRWRYDIMRALDYFQACNLLRDSRLDEAIAIIKKKRCADGTWVLQSKHPGRIFLKWNSSESPAAGIPCARCAFCNGMNGMSNRFMPAI
ncbi:hypothetical protein EDS67_05170 [candidate division KSB1 bacterium]|nr:MAG: hypothetical protein EDS67_05170 [candidate division KSB1 bacterium]MBC6950983.1 hypothetical protein [candidate division KSB1 bacterium]MCE7940753.1 hypothetical protein [Chlorobi bacterium CHB1]MDL1876196.1 hypothetical protein [Cytophagia bacterium CHB2]RIK56691.1 MAG: hypothetical protein DCC62_30250 [candidate division KSB1 bacterium]